MTVSFVMPNFKENLAVEPIPPVHIMREAAEALADSTEGEVQGSVFTLNPGGSNIFRHTFYLRAPALNDYTYPLFYVWHDKTAYPAHVLRAGGDQATETRDCDNPGALRQELETLFQENSTRQMIRLLLTQVE